MSKYSTVGNCMSCFYPIYQDDYYLGSAIVCDECDLVFCTGCSVAGICFDCKEVIELGKND